MAPNAKYSIQITQLYILVFVIMVYIPPETYLGLVLDLSNATNLIGLKQNRAKQIHAYVAGVAKHALIIQSELIKHS